MRWPKAKQKIPIHSNRSSFDFSFACEFSILFNVAYCHSLRNPDLNRFFVFMAQFFFEARVVAIELIQTHSGHPGECGGFCSGGDSKCSDLGPLMRGMDLHESELPEMGGNGRCGQKFRKVVHRFFWDGPAVGKRPEISASSFPDGLSNSSFARIVSGNGQIPGIEP